MKSRSSGKENCGRCEPALIKSAPILSGVILSLILLSLCVNAYSGSLLLDLNKTREDFSNRKIGTAMLDSYMSNISYAVENEDYAEADRLSDEAGLFSVRTIGLWDDIGKIEQACAIQGCEDARRKAKEAHFEMSIGNFETADRLRNESGAELKKVYSMKKQEIIDLLISSNFSGKKYDELIRFVAAIGNNETGKIIFFEKEVMLYIGSERSIRKIRLLLDEYSRIGGKSRLSDGLDEMSLNLDLGNYEKVTDIEAGLINAYSLANETANLIGYAEKRGYDEKSLSRIGEAKLAFKEERFEDSFELIKRTIDEGERRRSESMLLTKISGSDSSRMKEFIEKHILAIIVLSAIACGGIAMEYPRVKRRIDRWRILKLKSGIAKRNEAIADLQRKYYIDKKIPGKIYRSLLLDNQKKITGMKERVALISEDRKASKSVEGGSI